MATFTGKEIAEGIKRLGELAVESGIAIELTLIGGALMVLRFQARESTRDIPVVFMTSLADTQDKLTAFAVGAVDYVVKPLQVEEVMARVNAQLALRAMHRQLAAANRELEAFSYSVSHDLRAPLRAISSFAQILYKDCRADLSEEGRRCLDKIIATSDRMATLIEDLLRYARTARSAAEAVPVPLAPLAQHLTTVFGERIASAGARVEIVEPLDTPLGDPTLIGQILNNLLDNALTYRCVHGTPRIRITSRRIGAHVVIEVVDNGIGIEPEYYEKIFQVFQREAGRRELLQTHDGSDSNRNRKVKCEKRLEDTKLWQTNWRQSTTGIDYPRYSKDSDLAADRQFTQASQVQVHDQARTPVKR